MYNILKQYKKESQRNKALGTLLGTEPPGGLTENGILEWTKLKIKEKTRIVILIAYIATLITAITILGITYQKTQEKPANLEIIELNEN